MARFSNGGPKNELVSLESLMLPERTILKQRFMAHSGLTPENHLKRLEGDIPMPRFTTKTDYTPENYPELAKLYYQAKEVAGLVIEVASGERPMPDGFCALLTFAHQNDGHRAVVKLYLRLHQTFDLDYTRRESIYERGRGRKLLTWALFLTFLYRKTGSDPADAAELLPKMRFSGRNEPDLSISDFMKVLTQTRRVLFAT
jgi:hypothetical protein